MIPSAINSDYPTFVPNQVLTSDNLNDLFGYLDEQQRLTRANLLGIGIVCGLQVKTGTDANGKYIIIKKGTGVTSQGYLVTVPELKYHHYNQFDAVKPQYYDRFVNIGAKTQKMPLWELKQLGEPEDEDNPFHSLNDPAGFLDNKIVMLFVELLETNNKNCDPNSCDDKGITVTVSFRPLLILKPDAEAHLLKNISQSIQKQAMSLPVLKMRRYNVESTLLLDSEDVLKAYQDILTESFIKSVRSALSEAWQKLSPLLSDIFPSDPFNNLDAQFSFLYDGSISEKQAINLQYYYDFFSDLVAGYDELKRKAFEVVCECVPDESLFPRHLLVGEAIGFDELNSLYRTRFISSPVLSCCEDDANTVRSLMRRLALMIGNFSLEAADKEFRKQDTGIKITPSLLGKDPLSEKAIPFYYKPNEGSHPLYLSWDRQRTVRGTAHQILSYNSSDYNTSDGFVKHPLQYDLEPNNFLRIEGHIGQDYRKVMADLDKKKKTNRLPIDVIALSSDTRGIIDILRAVSDMDTSGSIIAAFGIMVKHPSCFTDLFLALDEWISKLRCCLLESRKYYIALPAYQKRVMMTNLERRMVTDDVAGETISPDPEDTIGKLYEEKLKEGSLSEKYCGGVFVDIATTKVHHATALVMMPYKIDGMISILPDHITKLDARTLETKYQDLTGTSVQLKAMYASKNVSDTMPEVDIARLSMQLDMSCLVCLFQELRLLVREFLLRLLGLMLRQKLGYYAYINPGIQHKAGVPVGGTFILVYHEASEITREDERKGFKTAFRQVSSKTGQAASALFSGDQPLLSSFLLLEEILFLTKVAGTPDEANEILDKIIGSIPAGTVIADFYLPYLCSGTCTPTQLLVLPSEPQNKPPVAKAGDSISIELPVNEVTLDGTSSEDPDGTIQAYKWEQVSGPGAANIDSPDSATTKVSGLKVGEYVFKLMVTDNDGAVDEDTVVVKVTEAPNVLPKAFATVDKPVVIFGTNAVARLSGEQSYDPDGNIETYNWKETAQPTGKAIIETPNAAASNVRFLDTGTYVFSLTVTDNRGDSANAEVTVVVVKPENKPPVADAGKDRQVELKSENDSFDLDGSNSFDPEGGPLTYLWTFASGPVNPGIADPDKPIATVSGVREGEYKFLLTVKDDGNNSASDTVVISVKIKQEIVKTCGPLGEILSQFNSWNKRAKKSPAFMDIFSSYSEVAEFFSSLSGIVTLPADQQVEFFLKNETPELLIKWLNELQNIIQQSKDLRLLALMLYRILNLLAMYIVCIQNEDFDKAAVPMNGVFDLVRSHVSVWKIMISQDQFSEPEMSVVKDIGQDIQNEIERVKSNGEEKVKASYLKALSEILEIIASIF